VLARDPMLSQMHRSSGDGSVRGGEESKKLARDQYKNASVSVDVRTSLHTRTAVPPVGSTTHLTFDSLPSLQKPMFIRRGASPTCAASQPRIATLQPRKQSDDHQGAQDQEAKAPKSELLPLQTAFHFTLLIKQNCRIDVH
jgi:hypothetical protein